MEKYEFLSKISEGAYGAVWRCVDKNTKRVVAVKKLKEATPVDCEVGAHGWRVEFTVERGDGCVEDEKRGPEEATTLGCKVEPALWAHGS